ncbi:MAG: non-canonical purine NTP pyrophosphatase, partial [Oscillospiraceae bacterium]|nr:non-canonical purine NTP pyrophosphatase [Oscillospiraceae bacterium]
CEGAIGYEKRGENGFGYDPVFLVEGGSFAEISDAEKDRISHRGRALRAFEQKLRARKTEQ